jgi:hypothetical protein
MKNTLDRYFALFVLKPASGTTEVVLMGYFDSAVEFTEITRKISARVQGKSTLDYFIHSFPSRKPLIQSRTAHIDDTGILAIDTDRFDMKSEQGIAQFVEKHFTIPHPGILRHYWVEISLEFDTMVEKYTILGYFSAINEFYEILKEVGSRINDAGNIDFQIYESLTNRKISSHIYRIQAKGEIILPDNHLAHYSLRKEKGLQDFSLFVWENDFVE